MSLKYPVQASFLESDEQSLHALVRAWTCRCITTLHDIAKHSGGTSTRRRLLISSTSPPRLHDDNGDHDGTFKVDSPSKSKMNVNIFRIKAKMLRMRTTASFIMELGMHSSLEQEDVMLRDAKSFS